MDSACRGVREHQTTVDVPQSARGKIFAGVDCHITPGIQLHKEAQPILPTAAQQTEDAARAHGAPTRAVANGGARACAIDEGVETVLHAALRDGLIRSAGISGTKGPAVSEDMQRRGHAASLTFPVSCFLLRSADDDSRPSPLGTDGVIARTATRANGTQETDGSGGTAGTAASSSSEKASAVSSSSSSSAGSGGSGGIGGSGGAPGGWAAEVQWRERGQWRPGRRGEWRERGQCGALGAGGMGTAARAARASARRPCSSGAALLLVGRSCRRSHDVAMRRDPLRRALTRGGLGDGIKRIP